jgi:outer membrane protein OmpA-like peptidoglycan-associated protein
MKKLLIILFSSLGVGAAAQNISLSNIDTQMEDGELNLDFDISASEMNLRCNGQLVLEFAVENGERRVVLPLVIFSGRARSKYENRRRILSDKYSAELYRDVNKISKRGTHELHYNLAVPLQEWMSQAELTVREYTHDCDGERLTFSSVLAQIGRREEPVVAVSEPEPVPVMEPEVRTVTLSLPITFKRGDMAVLVNFENNLNELQRVDRLFEELQDKDITAVSIYGYASPEGGWRRNNELAQGRMQNFKRWMTGRFPNRQAVQSATVDWMAEDWHGLEKAVEQGSITNKEEVLRVIRSVMSPDSKEAALKEIVPWSGVYRVLLDDFFPPLRRIDLTVSYTETE